MKVTHRDNWCTGVCEQVVTGCVMSESCGTAVIHLPGLFWRSIAERAEHRTVELREQRGGVRRLFQQVHTYTNIRSPSHLQTSCCCSLQNSPPEGFVCPHGQQQTHTQLFRSLCFSTFDSTCLSVCLSVSPQAEETSFHFDGSGFSLVQKSLRATSTSIVLLFKTLSPGGLLLYLASNNTV